jgi:hypothetical protein
MPYDDDGSLLRFRDFEDLAIVLERYLLAPENLTVARVLPLTQAVHVIAAGRGPERLEFQALTHGLRLRGIATIPFDTVIRVVEVVSRIPAEKDALAHVTPRDLQRIIQK